MTKYELARFALLVFGIACVLIGSLTMTGFPPTDPSAWLMIFGVGFLWRLCD
jgi:hypothetical protein